MNIKIEKGTVRSDIHLCSSCYFYKERRHENNSVVRLCNAMEDNDSAAFWTRLENSRVVECSIYHAAGNSSLVAMNSIAWQLIKDENGEPTFFDQNAMRRARAQVVSRKPWWKRLLRIRG